jgi:hypothetical protein
MISVLPRIEWNQLGRFSRIWSDLVRQLSFKGI